MKTNKTFNKVLEQYVFEIASTFIEPAEPTTQSSFIDLFSRIDSVGTLDKMANSQFAHGITQDLENEWQQVLDEPVDWRVVHRQWRINILQQRMKSREAYIANLKLAILLALEQYRYIQMTVTQEPYRSKLLGIQKRTLDMYRRHLAQARSFQASNEKQLNQLQSQ